MKKKFKLFDSVVTLRDLTQPDLAGFWGRGKRDLIDGKPGAVKGTHGAIVELFESPEGIIVELFDDNGETIDVASIPLNYIRRATKVELDARAARRAAHESAVP